MTTTPFPSAPTGPVAPAKYTKAALKSCLDIKQETGGDLPPSEPDEAKHPTACGLEVLDENAVLTVIRNSGTAIDEEQCRESVRELAKTFYAAVQP